MEKESKVKFPDIIRRSELEVESEWEGLRGFMFEGPDGSQVIFWECSAEIKIGPHKHNFDEYCLVVEGVCKETIEGETKILNKGDECAIPAGKFAVGDWAMAAAIGQFTELTLEFSESTNEKLKNMVEAIIQEEILFPIYNKYMFVVGDFSTAIPAIAV